MDRELFGDPDPAGEPATPMEWAVAYAELGIPVFPCAITRDPSAPDKTNKRPLTEHGHRDASTDVDQICKWWSRHPDAAIGGHLAAIDVAALDVDVAGGKGGDDQFHDVETKHGAVGDTVVVITPSGGRHLWVAMNDTRIGSGNLRSLDAPHVDVKGDGGWVVLPGSRSPLGTYVFEVDCSVLDGVAPAPAPAWLARAVPSGGGGASSGPTSGRWQRLDTPESRRHLDPLNAEALELLERLGGHDAIEFPDSTIRVTRPGKRSGTSASIGKSAPGVVYVFSSGWAKVPHGFHDIDALERIARTAPTDDRPRFRFHSAADRLDNIPAVSWAVTGYRIDNTFGTTAGELKTLKSTLAMEVSVALAAGVPALGHFDVPAPRPVLYVVGEGGDIPFRRRLLRLRDAHGLTNDDLRHFAYTTDTAPLTDIEFTDELAAQMKSLQAAAGCPGLIVIDPKYAVHPNSVDAKNLLSEGAFLREVTAPIIDAGWAFDLVDHYNQTGSGNGLKRVTMAGAGEWADSWTLLAHREQPDVDAGRFRLTMDVGSRQWGGTSLHVDVGLGHFDPDLGAHDGDITFSVRPAGHDDQGDGDDVDQRTAVEVLRVLRRARKAVTRTDVVQRAKARDTDVRRVLSEMIDDGRVIETPGIYTDAAGRAQRRVVLALHPRLADDGAGGPKRPSTDWPGSTS